METSSPQAAMRPDAGAGEPSSAMSPSLATVARLCEEQAIRSPEAIAVVYGEEALTYREVNERANQLAHYLRKRGVVADTLVGVFLDRSEAMVIALLGILKAGGAYLPLDPAYPRERLSFMCQDADLGFLLTQAGLRDVLPAHNATVVCLDAIAEDLDRASRQNPLSSDNCSSLSATTEFPDGTT